MILIIHYTTRINRFKVKAELTAISQRLAMCQEEITYKNFRQPGVESNLYINFRILEYTSRGIIRTFILRIAVFVL